MPTSLNSRRRSTCSIGGVSLTPCGTPVNSIANSFATVAQALGTIDSIRFRGVADVAAVRFMPLKTEPGLVFWPVDDERQPHRLPARTGIERGHPVVAVAVHLAAFVQLHQHAGGITEIEHRQTPHLPEIVSGMRIVGEFDVPCPALAETILDLSGYLLVGEIGQE